MRTEWYKRKAKVVDFVEGCADAMEKKPKEVMKLMCVETDAEVAAVMPEKHLVE